MADPGSDGELTQPHDIEAVLCNSKDMALVSGAWMGGYSSAITTGGLQCSVVFLFFVSGQFLELVADEPQGFIP